MINRRYVNYQGYQVPHIYGSKGCFPAGVLITMADGSKKPIENISPSDIVLTFKKFGELGPGTVTEVFYHEVDAVLKVTHQYGILYVTPNHWIIGSNNLFKEIQEFQVGDELVLESGTLSNILKIERVDDAPVYNFTVPSTQTYIADGIRVHNKGGGKGGSGSGKEDPNNLFSTDILFVTAALGEGPMYRINPNGPQDIEINDGNVDDLINIDGDGTERGEVFQSRVNTGTTVQAPLPIFGEQTVGPQNFSSAVTLKKGNVAGVARSRIFQQSTSANDWDSIKFAFLISGLQESKDNGDILQRKVAVKVTLLDATGTTVISETEREIIGKTNSAFKFTIDVPIAASDQSSSGYKFTIEKTSDDSDSSKIQETVQSIGWFEIENKPQAYPRTAHIGYALKAFGEHKAGVPTFTSLVKGLVVKVPSNYIQPILASGEIDWRELELSQTTSDGYVSNGYRLQNPGTGSVLTTANPVLYIGPWDGSFVYSWTQNPVWIIYDILTNKTYGLGVAEENIDKFKFFKVAKYCDACDDSSGKFFGVDGLADGTFRHKPKGKFTSVRDTLIGVEEGTKIKQRRFTFDGIIADQGQALDVINQIAASIRGALVYSAGQITMAVDVPDELPVAMFNEVNIKDNSVTISGTKESDLFTGVDVSYVDPTNHYKRETVRIDITDANDGTDRSVIENIASLDLFGTTRRSQALRYAQYQIASSKFLRRKLDFTTSLDAMALAPGDVISIAQRQIGVAFGFAGKVAVSSNTGANHSNVIMEHFTTPSITALDFTANTNPLALRIIKQDSDRIDLYILSNNLFNVGSTGLTSTGADQIEVKIDQRYDPIRKALQAVTQFGANNLPQKGDIWSFGEWDNPDDIYTNKAGKLFKITSLERDTKEEEVGISAIEYISNVYVDADTFIDYTPTAYLDTRSPLVAPPSPAFNIRPAPRREQDGSIRVDLALDISTENLDYGIQFETEFFVSFPDVSQHAATILSSPSSTQPLRLRASNVNQLENDVTPIALIGKNGFDSQVGKIRLLCNAVSIASSGTDAVDNIRLQVEGMSVLTDYNYLNSGVPKHVLDTNDDTTRAVRGDDFVSVPIAVTQTGGDRNFVAAGPTSTQISANIRHHTGNFIFIENPTTEALPLLNKLPSAPFYIEIFQQLHSEQFNTRANFYVGGSEFTFTQRNAIASPGSAHVEPLQIKPRHEKFVKVYLDNIEKSDFTLTTTSTPATLSVTTDSDDSEIRVEVDHYTVPVIEVGDNVQFSTGNTFVVASSSYDPESPTFNAQFTSNSVYQIELATTPGTNRNLNGVTLVNIGVDPIGRTNNVTTSNTSFTIDYDRGAFPGNFRLVNSHVYTITTGGEFEKTFLGKDRILRNVPIGTTTVKARNKNLTGRSSPFVTKSVQIGSLPISKVTGIRITEGLYTDALGGVAVRVIIKFKHVTGQEVTDYELSYRTDNQENTDLSTFSTVKIPANNIDENGDITHVINNIDRGATTSVNLIVRITALNKSLKGSVAQTSATILGKTAKPRNILNFGAGQTNNQITLFWDYERQEDGSLFDLDLKEIIIRRIPGADVAATEENFAAGSAFVTVAAGVSRKSSPIDTFGVFTYLARTRDTSGNFSDGIVLSTLTTFRPGGQNVIKAFNTDAPSVVFAGIANENASEAAFVSLTGTTTGGLNVASGSSTVADRANASATGWSYNAGLAATDLQAEGDATYISPIRDVGQVITGSIQLDIQGTSASRTTFNDFKEIILSGATEAQAATVNNKVLKDTNFGGIGTVLGFSNTALSFSFNKDNQTLVDTTTTQNVYAIVNPGQFTGNVISISAITKASPAVVTTSGSEHGIEGTKRVIFHDVAGMTQLNNRELFATRVNATTLNIFQNSGGSSALDSSGFTTYVSGGVLDQGDFSNANALALIAGVINADHIALGATFHANGESTAGNTFANVATENNGVNNYQLVNLKQFQDETGTTFAGPTSSITQQTFIRTSSSDEEGLFKVRTEDEIVSGEGAHTNANVNVAAFDFSATNDGFIPYEAGSKRFRFFQTKFVVLNQTPNEIDFTLDKFRVSVEKDITTLTNNHTFDNTIKFVSFADAGFIQTPSVSIQPLNTATAQVAFTVETTADHVAYKLFDIENDTLSPINASPLIQVSLVATGI